MWCIGMPLKRKYPNMDSLQSHEILIPAMEEMNVLGIVIRGSAIPVIVPQSAKAFSEFRPLFSKLDGIINCFSVDKPERIYEVKEIGSKILKIL